MATFIASWPTTLCRPYSSVVHFFSVLLVHTSNSLRVLLCSYPGWDLYIDSSTRPAPTRIAYGIGSTGPIFDLNSKAMACNSNPRPAPGAIAEVRAGSNVTFHWSRWLYSHKGPISAWMAPYDGSVADVNVNKLEFFKIGEESVDSAGVWGTEKLLDKTNGTWTTTIPADIKPGNYIIRHEVLPSLPLLLSPSSFSPLLLARTTHSEIWPA